MNRDLVAKFKTLSLYLLEIKRTILIHPWIQKITKTTVIIPLISLMACSKDSQSLTSADSPQPPPLPSEPTVNGLDLTGTRESSEIICQDLDSGEIVAYGILDDNSDKETFYIQGNKILIELSGDGGLGVGSCTTQLEGSILATSTTEPDPGNHIGTIQLGAMTAKISTNSGHCGTILEFTMSLGSLQSPAVYIEYQKDEVVPSYSFDFIYSNNNLLLPTSIKASGYANSVCFMNYSVSP